MKFVISRKVFGVFTFRHLPQFTETINLHVTEEDICSRYGYISNFTV